MKKRIKKTVVEGLLDTSAAQSPVDGKIDLLERLRGLFQRPPVEPPIELTPGAVNVVELIAPPSVDLTHKDYITVDGVYHAYLYIAGYGYATTVGSGWLSSLVEAGEGINVSFQLSRQPRERILKQISQATMVNRSRMRDVDDTRQDFEALDSAIASGLYLKDAMNRQNEDLHFMHTLIEISADNADTLEQRIERVQNLCVSQDMICKRADYYHPQGFLSMLPTLGMDADIERKTRRNVLTSGAASAFPFSSFEVFDPAGIPIGLMQHNRSLCMPDFFNTGTYSNGNIFITGMSGSGKTYLLSILTIMLRLQGVKVIVIAPLKGFEYRLASEAMGGSYIKLSPSSGDCINLLAIRKTTLHTEDGLSEARDDSLLADQIQTVHIYMRLRKRDMTGQEEHLLDAALVELYARFGITFDNSSVTLPDGTFKPMPTFGDLYGLLMEREETHGLAASISRYVTGSARSLGGETNVNLDSDYTVIDISEMPEDMLPEWMFGTTKYAFDECSRSRVSKKALVLDELWYLIGAMSTPLSAGFVVKIFKILRGMGAIAVGATQDFSDCFSLEDGKYGKAILNNTRVKFIFPLEEEELAFAQDKLKLTDEEVMQLSRHHRGECLFGIGRNRVSISVHTSPMVHNLITTDRAEMERRAQQTEIGGSL